MANNSDYEYMNENSIHEDLICSICTDPFEDPVCANQCGHTFCRKCIKNSFHTMSTCPTCRQILTLKDFLPVTTRPFLNQLNRIHVKCKWCDQINIQRSNFKDHAKTCMKIIVSCPASDIKCDWTGKSDTMQDHINICPLIKVQPAIIELKTLVKQQSKQIRFLYTILEKTADNHEQACQEGYPKDQPAYCDICEEELIFTNHNRCLHFCPNTDICLNCVKKHFS